MVHTTEDSKRITVELELDPTVNFAMQQNDVPVIKRLCIVNGTESQLDKVMVQVTCEPEFAAAWQTYIATIQPGGSYDLGKIDLPLSAGYLAQLTERLTGAIHIQVLAGGQLLAQQSSRIEVLAYDEWNGMRSLPEILAAFVVPNHPVIESVLGDAASILGKETGDSSLSGYQSKKRDRVFRMLGAIYAAIARQNIRYINPPASFEDSGQKIRLPDRILEHKLGTCLDLATLFAACLEQAGLFPLIIIMQGHAFVGVWLDEECFADCAIDDPLRIRKRVELNEISVCETTLLTEQPPASFGQALDAGRRLLNDTGRFLCAIDIQRARKGRIRPLPVRASGVVRQPRADEDLFAPQATVVLPELPDTVEAPSAKQEMVETPAARLDRWKRKLLDLTLHNRLLNFRESHKTLGIMCPDLAELEDVLAEGEKFQVHARPHDMRDGQRDAEVHQKRTGKDAIEELLREEFRSRRLHAPNEQVEVNRRLLEIYRTAKASLEEGGASALYLAIGFLAWYEDKSSEKRCLAPIILLPLEMERRSIQEGFRIRQGDDEPQVNITLLELLSQDHALRIPNMDPIPKDEHGIDVKGILTAFRQAVKEIDRWEVIEDAQIGLFSFTKFLMWRDLQQRTDDLRRNKVVNHLIDHANEPFPDSRAFPQEETLDDGYKPDETFCPLPSDSSQLAAVYAAAEGKSFVLHGPPGTGKSQTIANLIAHSLAMGKSVLFVSEKMAALRVVQQRLKACGLGPFCLELHSNKTQKLEVTRQLGQGLQRIDIKTPEDWTTEARRLAATRGKLNQYVQALHQKRGIGESIFQGTSRLTGLRNARKVNLSWPSADAVKRDRLDRMKDIVSQMQVAGEACGHPAGNIWTGVGLQEWSPACQRELEELLPKVIEAGNILNERLKQAAPLLGFGTEKWSLKAFEAVKKIIVFLLSAPELPSALLTEPDWPETISFVRECITHGCRRDVLRAEVFAKFTNKVLDLNIGDLIRSVTESERKWAPLAWLARQKVRKILKQAMQAGVKPSTSELRKDLERVSELLLEQHKIASAADRAHQLLGPFWKDGEADWRQLESFLEWDDKFRKHAIAAAGNNPNLSSDYRTTWAKLVTENRESLQPETPIGSQLAEYCAAWEAFAHLKKALEAKLVLESGTVWSPGVPSPKLDGVLARAQSWNTNMQGLQAWCNWRAVRQAALGLLLEPVVRTYEQDALSTADLMKVFERSFYQWWVETITEAEPALRTFFGPEHERMIREFKKIDDRYLQLSRNEIQARLAARVPTAGDRVNENSEMGILRHQVQRQRGHMPVRQLIQRIPNLLPRLKPCLLMSPISVAQYLDSAHPPFDLVVFDEASQIPVWDAVGAIARGKEVVIVGDPKQLPPTNFFNRSDEQEMNDDDVVEDLESILDDCKACGLPEMQLRWHYRSRHESLIAFSNHYYYDNNLLTFPSPYRNQGVTFQYVNGIYDKGKSCTNRAEAEAVVDHIIRRLSAPRQQAYSIGVVTFSIKQQALIEDLLEEARRSNPEIEPHFAEDAAEPVFVKNLENVQGDERDMILLSICHGPDEQGRVSHNFGPLNRDGGHRRLNVAITRARVGLVVFSSLRADQIELARTRSQGVRDLKAFLDYAERGSQALSEAVAFRPDADFDSPFEKEVCEELRKRGAEVHPQVGCSGYRIDLAIVDPQNPGCYLLGIECDGANYHRAKTARDRDRLRQDILVSLGWRIHRVWSSDWWHNRDEQLAKIEAAIEKAKLEGPAVPGEKPKEFQTAPAEPAVTRIASAPTAIPRTGTTSGSQKPLLPAYRPFSETSPARYGDDFYSPSIDNLMIKVLQDVVAKEGPISVELAAKRVATYWGIQRARSKAVDRVAGLARKAQIRQMKHGNKVFMWPLSLDPQQYHLFRVPSDDDESKRKADDIPPEEVANAASYVLQQQVSLPLDDLVTETARLLGYQRSGAVVEKSMTTGIRLLLAQRRAAEQDGMVVHL